MNKLRPFLAFLGNLLDHYSSAVFCLSVPLLMPFFFPHSSISEQIIKAFSLFPLTVITKPLGAIFFSYLSQKKSPEFSLKISYCGMALTCLSFALIPLRASSDTVYIFLMSSRLLQGFFSSGETICGAMYVLDQTCEKRKGLASGFYDACSLAGYVVASFLIYHFQINHLFENHWRILFLLGTLSVLPAFFLKKPSYAPEDNIQAPVKLINALQIIIVTGLSYAFFSLCFVFTSTPGVLYKTNQTHLITKHTTYLLLIDLMLLPLCGLISRKIPYTQMMRVSLFLALILVPFFLFSAEQLCSSQLLILRLLFTILGAIFSSGVFRFCKDTLPYKNQSQALSFSFSLGAALIGQSFALVSASLYKFLPSIFFVGLFFSFLCLLGLTALQKNLEKDPKLV